MENGQLAERLEWLDSERRSAQELIAKLEKRVSELETALEAEKKAVKPLQQELTRVGVQISKLDDFEQQLKAYKKELQAEAKKADAETQKIRKEFDSSQLAEEQRFNKLIQALERDIAALKPLEEQVKLQQREDGALNEKLAKLSKDLEAVQEGEQRRQDVITTLNEDSIKDSKRLAEMSGNLDAVVKNAEKAIAKVDLVADDQRKLEKQMDSVDQAQIELRDQQREFMEQSAVRQSERDREWKEWSKRFEEIERTSDEVRVRLQELGATDAAVKRAQKAFDELVEKINRRVNEFNEIQRLGEQRLRQEWSTFQADTQKRWSNFNLGYDEQRQEAKRQRERLSEHVTRIEDDLQETRDTVQHLGEQIERYFQAMLEVFRETLAENERFFG